MKEDHTQWLYKSTNEYCPRGTIKKKNEDTHKKYEKANHKANADYSQNIFQELWMRVRGTLRAGYIWAIIKASLFLLLYSFLTFMCGWLYKYYDLWILPWLPAWLLIIIPKFFFYFLFFPLQIFFFCCLIKIFVTLWELVMILWMLRVATSDVWSVESSCEKNSFCNLRRWCFRISSRG